MIDPIPILILGDAPNHPTGLARIARDLAWHLHHGGLGQNLPVRVGQLGLGYDGSPWPWPVFPVLDEKNWAEGDLERTWAWFAGGAAGVLFVVWDPARALGAATVADSLPVDLWGYFAIDGANSLGRIGGPAAGALHRFNRVLAYGAYGAKVLSETLERQELQWLPHGVDFVTFQPRGVEALGDRARHAYHGWRGSKDEDCFRVGVVATNQARKDFATAFQAAAMLKHYGETKHSCALWVHVDKLISRYWSIPELADLYGFNDDSLLITAGLMDEELAAFYSLSDVTIAPGLGEGFGYPIVESLACGTPVVHVNYAGGAELVPRRDWLIGPVLYRYEGPYVVKRPVVTEVGVALHVLAVEQYRRALGGEVLKAYCRGAVQNLDWAKLWAYWRSWFKQGIEERFVSAPEET